MKRLTSQSRSRSIGAAAALVLTLVLFGVVGAIASSTPMACASCHAMRPFADSLSKSAHARIHCYDCHLERGAWSLPSEKWAELTAMLPASLSGSGVSGPGSPVSSSACRSCHGRIFDGVTARNGLRFDHTFCASTPAQCTDCHSATAHGRSTRWVRTPVMEECVRCHVDRGASMTCDTCHTGRDRRARLRVGPWQVTHGATWKATHGLGDLRLCRTCHRADYCVSCHATPLPHGVDFGRTHGAEAKGPAAKCLDCHDKKSLCDPCHRMDMPHPAGFLKTHAASVRLSREATCLRCHAKVDCTGCHVAHVHPGRTDGTLGRGINGAIGGPAPRRSR
ncbi:MAG: NapC/NirT family cytochrome c [Coriobacteriia bacterium]|nr:NapC/NirT family cytochrome c [Coriobacteriia bacterium]